MPDALGEEPARARVRDHAQVDEREQEVGGLGGHDEVAGQRERAAEPRRHAVHRGDHRLRRAPDLEHDRVVDLAQAAGQVRRAVGGLLAGVLDVGAGRERAARAGDQHRPHVVVGGGLPEGVQ